MSKQKAKAKKAASKPAKRAAVKTKKKMARRAVSAGMGPSQRTSAATIFVYKADEGYRVRTSPQLLSCPPGSIEWTVVNLTSDPMPDVEITWPKGGPWGNAPIPIRGGNVRKSLAGAQQGRFKYDVTCNGFTEDPEVEWPEM